MSSSPEQRKPASGSLLTAVEVQQVRKAFHQLLQPNHQIEPGLAGVINDTLDNPGSLFRAQLAFGIQTIRGTDPDQALKLATAIEYFHTASLLFDDLPAMDDADERRGQPCPHTVHGQAATMLASLALINRAYELLWGVLGDLPESPRKAASQLVGSCLGMSGILNGQARDLTFVPGSGGRAVQEVARGKTVTLVRLSLLLPAVVAGASEIEQERLNALATVWGLAYQGLDDFKDLCLSRREAGKSTGRDRALGRPSLPREMGDRQALAFLDKQLNRGAELVQSLGRSWSLLQGLQEVLLEERARLADALLSTQLQTRSGPKSSCAKSPSAASSPVADSNSDSWLADTSFVPSSRRHSSLSRSNLSPSPWNQTPAEHLVTTQG